MNINDYIVSLEGVSDYKAFFAELLDFYAPLEAVLIIWGKLPKEIQNRLFPFKAQCPWIRRWFFHQSEWHLTSQSLKMLKEHLCNDDLLETITWGLTKSDIPLGLCRSWDDMNLDGSALVEETKLFKWLDHLKSMGLVQSYEKIMG